MTPLANTNLHLLQEGAVSSNGFSFSWGWGPGQYDGPTWTAHFYRYSRQRRGRKNMSSFASEVLFLDAWVSYVISNHPFSVFEACVFCLLWYQLWTFLHLPVQWEFPWSWHVWDHGEKSAFFVSLCAVSLFMLKEPTCTYAWLEQLFRFYCSPSNLKCMCNWAAHLHIWWCPGGVDAERETGSENKPIFQVLHHAVTLGSFPKQCFQQLKNTCVGISKRKSLCYLLADFKQLFL